jgi:hypothetical protein
MYNFMQDTDLYYSGMVASNVVFDVSRENHAAYLSMVKKI